MGEGDGNGTGEGDDRAVARQDALAGGSPGWAVGGVSGERSPRDCPQGTFKEREFFLSPCFGFDDRLYSKRTEDRNCPEYLYLR